MNGLPKTSSLESLALKQETSSKQVLEMKYWIKSRNVTLLSALASFPDIQLGVLLQDLTLKCDSKRENV